MMRLRSLASSRRRIATLSLVLAALLLGAYLLWSKQVWTQYTPVYKQWSADSKTAFDRTMVLPATSAKEQEIVSGKLKELSAHINSRQNSVCAVNPLIQWQRLIIKSLDEMQAKCRNTASKLNEFRSQLDTVMAYKEDDWRLAKILGTVPQVGELSDTVWGKQSAAWDTVMREVKNLSVSDAFKPSQQRAVEKLMAVREAWQALNAAHEAKDKGRYASAVTALGVSYDGLNDIATVDEASFAVLSQALDDKYRLAFQ